MEYRLCNDYWEMVRVRDVCMMEGVECIDGWSIMDYGGRMSDGGYW